MEISDQDNNKPQQYVRDYWPKFRARSLFFVVAMQLIAALVIICVLLITNLADPLNLQFWIITGAIAVTNITLNVIVFTITTEPLKLLSHALAHVANETTRTTPPNPNVMRYQKNGFKPLLTTIYENARGASTKSAQATSNAENQTSIGKLLQRGLDESTTGIVFLGDNDRVLYANKAAPLREITDGGEQLELIFEDTVTFASWLAECREHSVHADTTWKRVANKIPGEEGRRIYDIAASYQKGSEVEVVITLFDRTADYQPEDDDLDFIAFAAHELRGPITVIRGYLDTLSDELSNRLANDEKELFDRLIVSANRLSGYVSNILNAAKYDRRHLKVQLREDTVADIYDSIRDDMAMRAAAQNRILEVSIPNNLPSVAADKSSISEVFSNLIDNALKYSSEGGLVKLSAQTVGSMVEVSVTDNGIGMPSNVVSNLFHKFYRSHRSRETVAGTGIGLYLSKAIVESHGGSIGVRSVEGEGSTFTFTLPIYTTVAEKLKAHHNSNESFIEKNQDGWIKNHTTFRG